MSNVYQTTTGTKIVNKIIEVNGEMRMCPKPLHTNVLCP
jgi:hypothetical protein